MFNPNPWLKLSVDTFWLGAEASQVVALRMMKLAGGGTGAAAEAQRMVTEKVAAAMAAHTELTLGAISGSPHAGPTKAVALYRRKVRANRRRLAREA
ncbi:hypothetical protein [Phenylobacterium sp.]|uniref:hypothetical protein n=1 Tax=Phenylobacterium sp. TaxID=1871053 RepID=UPI00289DAEE6|nr:hypothetical protein [Phenylobacterium sp.]